MTRNLTARLAALEAKRNPPLPKPVQIGRFPPKFEMVDGVLYQRPGLAHDEWAVFARKQQAELLARLKVLAEDEPDDEPAKRSAAMPVGTITDGPAPLKPGQKRPKFVEINGVEYERTEHGLVPTGAEPKQPLTFSWGRR